METRQQITRSEWTERFAAARLEKAKRLSDTKLFEVCEKAYRPVAHNPNEKLGTLFRKAGREMQNGKKLSPQARKGLEEFISQEINFPI